DDAVELRHEIQVPPVAAHLAVGDGLQADGLLPGYGFLDAAVFDFPELFAFQDFSRFHELPGPQKASYLVGAERRFHLRGFNPDRVTRPCSSRPSACSQNSAVSSSRSKSIP